MNPGQTGQGAPSGTSSRERVLGGFPAAHSSVQVRSGSTENWGCRVGMG